MNSVVKIAAFVFTCVLIGGCGAGDSNSLSSKTIGKKVTKDTENIQCVTGGSLYNYVVSLTGYVEDVNDTAFKVRVSEVELQGGGDPSYSRCVYYGVQDAKKRIGNVEYWEKLDVVPVN